MPEPTGRPASAASGFVAPADGSALRLQQLARVTSELGAAKSMDDIVAAAVTHFAEAVAAAVATLMVRTDDQLVMVAGHGLQPGIEERWAVFGVDADNPASEAVRTGRPVFMGDSAVIQRRYTSLKDQVPEGRSIVCLPLGSRDAPVGVVGLTFEDDWLPGPSELDFLTTFADACGQAIQRVRASESARVQAAQLSFLSQASAVLASSLDYRATLGTVADILVPSMADWCAVSLLRADKTLETVAVAHADPAKVSWARELEQRYPTDEAAPTGVANVVRTGRSELYREITDDMLVAGARDAEHLRLSRELDLTSAMVVPLSARGRTLGAMTLLRAGEADRYTHSDLSIAEDLGRRAGIAIDNAVLFGESQNVARQLQHAVLPERLEAAGWEIASHYAPGGRAEVGGDFYDAVELSDGSLAIFIGDVMGHGLVAAAAMAHMRAAVRAFVSVDPEPATVLSRLDQMFTRLAIKQLVTMFYALVDPLSATMSVACAGHLPPLIVTREGQTSFADVRIQRPLGAGGDDRTATILPFSPDQTVFLCTDGLIERRGEDIQIGLNRLARYATLMNGDRPLDRSVDELVSHLDQGNDGDDDVTVVAFRLAPRSAGSRLR